MEFIALVQAGSVPLVPVACPLNTASQTPRLHRIYIPSTPPVLCTDWLHVLW